MYRCILWLSVGREKGTAMKDTKKQELFDDMLRKFDTWRERACPKNRMSYEEAAKRYADYAGCSLDHALSIAWMD